jgi:hypothetical protein
MTSVQKWSIISAKRTQIQSTAPTIPNTSEIGTCSSKNALSDTSFGSVCSRPKQHPRRPTSCSFFLLFKFKQQQQQLCVFRLNKPHPAYSMCCTFRSRINSLEQYLVPISSSSCSLALISGDQQPAAQINSIVMITES